MKKKDTRKRDFTTPGPARRPQYKPRANKYRFPDELWDPPQIDPNWREQ